MKDLMKDIDWRKHLLGMVVLAITFVLLALAGAAYVDAKLSLNNAMANYHQQQSINSDAQSARALLSEYLPLYNELRDQGIIGPAQRLQWVETLQATAQDFQIPRVHFTLEATYMATDLDSPHTSPAVNMLITPMQLQLQLKHEGDLYFLLDALQHRSRGIFSVNRCELQQAEGKGKQKYLEGLKGNCELHWYTLQDITANWEDNKPL